jgi:prepilin-type N-terminal cleavage/methylation domain-containing protein
MHRHGRQAGFTLAELAIVLVIVSFLLGGTMAMVSTQTEQRNWNDTQRGLEAARDAILGYAIANGRLPCPANSTSAGAEVRQGSGVCGTAGNTYDYYGGVVPVAGVTYGLLPAVTIGYQPVDTQGFAQDAWGNRIRYAVSQVTTPAFAANFTNRNNLKTNGVSVLPNDLVVCASATGISAGPPGSCGAVPTNSVTSQNTVVAILYSPGKNGQAPITLGADEAANENRTGVNLGFGPGANDTVFVSHPPAPSTAANGEFDDQVLWISIGTLYSKLIAAGVLP